MSDYKKDLLNSINDLHLNEEIKLTDIPNLDLYMDQVITLFEMNLSGNKRNETDKILTKTMINNYTKDKILMPAKNKKYSREHIIMMIFIYNLKQGLAINDIKKLLSNIVQNFDDTENDLGLDKLYNTFLGIKESETNSFSKELESNMDLIINETSDLNEDTNYYKTLLTVLMLINKSNMYKKLAENIIDNCI